MSDADQQSKSSSKAVTKTTGHVITPEATAQGVVAALAARQELREKSRDPETLLNELADAAYGRGRWAKLIPDKRLAALVKLMEYSVQKAPRAGAVASDPPDEPDQSATSTMIIE